MCPGCGKDLRKLAGVDKALTDLANGLAVLQRDTKIEVEFVLPLDSADG
jgi:hypothetical protein